MAKSLEPVSFSTKGWQSDGRAAPQKPRTMPPQMTVTAMGGAQGDEDQREDAGEVQEVLTGQEDCLPGGDLGEYEVHDEAEDHD